MKEILEAYKYKNNDPYDYHDVAIASCICTEVQLQDLLADSVGIIGIPFDQAVRGRKGAKDGPNTIREMLATMQSYSAQVDLATKDIFDVGNVIFPEQKEAFETHEEHTKYIERSHKRICDILHRMSKTRCIPISLGGDHSITYPIVKGISQSYKDMRIGLINIDAHLDLRERIHGTISSGTPFRCIIEDEILIPSNVFEVGIRSHANSKYYMDYAQAQGIHVITMDDLYDTGIKHLLEKNIIPYLQAHVDAVYLSIDIDALDTAYAPGVSAVNPNGMQGPDVLYCIQKVCSELKILGADIVECNPSYDIADMTAKRAALMLLTCASALLKSC